MVLVGNRCERWKYEGADDELVDRPKLCMGGGRDSGRCEENCRRLHIAVGLAMVSIHLELLASDPPDLASTRGVLATASISLTAASTGRAVVRHLEDSAVTRWSCYSQ